MESIPAFLIGLIAILLLTCFIKIFTALNILRLGIGLQGNGFGVVILTLSFALTLLVMQPQFQAAGGFESIMQGQQPLSALETSFRPFLEKQIHKPVLERFEKFNQNLKKTPSGETIAPSIEVLIAAFIVSELKEAFQLALMLLIPFLVIDLLVVNVVMSLGISQVPAALISLPLKLFLLLAVDGWSLISDKLLQGYL